MIMYVVKPPAPMRDRDRPLHWPSTHGPCIDQSHLKAMTPRAEQVHNIQRHLSAIEMGETMSWCVLDPCRELQIETTTVLSRVEFPFASDKVDYQLTVVADHPDIFEIASIARCTASRR